MAWNDAQSMRQYHWQPDGVELPDWQKAYQRWLIKIGFRRVRHPSKDQLAGVKARPKLSGDEGQS
jgi:hypothetical protein